MPQVVTYYISVSLISKFQLHEDQKTVYGLMTDIQWLHTCDYLPLQCMQSGKYD